MHEYDTRPLVTPADLSGGAPISSLGDPRLSPVLALRSRAERDRAGAFVIEGVRDLIQANRRRYPLAAVFYSADDVAPDTTMALVRSYARRGVPTYAVASSVLKEVAWRVDPQGVLAIARQNWQPLAMSTPTAGVCWVAADGVAIPGNLGTILRTAQCIGAAGLIVLGDDTDPYDPNCVRASMGAILGLRLVRASCGELADWARRHRAPIIGTSPAGAETYTAVQYPPGAIVLIGSEKQGLAADREALCTRIVRIPMVAGPDSLNVAVATGVVLYEIYNQNHRGVCAPKPRACGSGRHVRG